MNDQSQQHPFRPLIRGFLDSVERFPERPALAVEGRFVTYRELRREACKMASAILEWDQENSPLIAVLASRSRTCYASVLGILMSGKGYVPLNPKVPVERTRRILRASGCRLVIAGAEAREQLSQLLQDFDEPSTFLLPEIEDIHNFSAALSSHRFLGPQEISAIKGNSSPRAGGCSAIAYLLFTSGSTGEPKGVPITQGNVRAYLDYICDRYDVSERDRFSQMFDLTFDLSVHDMFVCWERGACLFCVPEGSVMAPAKFIRDHELTMWFSVPSVVGVLDKMRLVSPGCFPSLRYSLFCGEPLPAAYARLWRRAAPDSILENLYGPTETTIAISRYRWEDSDAREECANGIVPIGRVFENASCIVIGRDNQPVPVGQSGELCLAGPQVAAGYWHNEDATRDRFGPLPQGGQAVWYRTGDLVRKDETGCLHFLGRLDQQVKIRGHRVELQEIDAVLRVACGSEQVVTLPRKTQNGAAESVIAFVSGVEDLDHARVLAYCRQFLPNYMVPQRLFELYEIPRTINGKVDRIALMERLKECDQ